MVITIRREMKFLVIFFLLCSVAHAGVNEKYSYKDFMGESFTHLPASEFNNSTIIGSNFYQENKPDEDIFPDGLVNVEFQKCNLDNVLIKTGMTADNTNAKKRIKAQNDLEDWIVEKVSDKWVAKEPHKKDKFAELGLSIDPKDIPVKKQTKSTTEKKREEINNSISN